MSDNSYGTAFGPSSPGAFNVVAGDTHGAICGSAKAVYGRSSPSTSMARGPRRSYPC